MTRYILPLLIIVLTTFLTGCRDEINYEVIGEGEASVSATVKFHPLISSNVNQEDSRTAGDAIRKIRNIQVVIYNAKGELYRVDRFGEGYGDSFTEGTQSGMPDDLKDADKSEASTATASFKLVDLPYGRYKMYIVANYPTLDETKIGTSIDLMNHTATWSEEAVSNNDQMFGYFAEDNQSEYADAPLLTINKSSVSLIGWIKRLASKLTIVYDGHELHEGINIYIKSVTVRDIPRTCVLGFNEQQLTPKQKEDLVNGNSPTSKAQLIDSPAHGTLYYRTVYKSSLTGEVDEVLTTDTDPKVEDYHDWMHVTKNTTAAGAVSVGDDHKLELDKDGNPVSHTETMQALYFYENCQGDYPGQSAYDKTPERDHVGKPETEEGIYKDKVPYGTYIEVEGYYVSSNPDNMSSGPIKYRFMLGQNTTYNYNALRNRHYKLWLKFRGYANQPEWHIVYEEEEPGMYPPDAFNVSYMYNTRHEMPVRLTGHPYKVTLQIIENNWAPYDATQPDSVAQAVTVAQSGSMVQDFYWYKEIYDQVNVPVQASDPTTGSMARYEILQNRSPRPASSLDGLSGYYYGKHNPTNYNSLTPYDPPVNYMAGEQITPIWAGFLSLQVPTAYDAYNTILPTGVQDKQGTDDYSKESTVQGMRRYYTGCGGTDSEGKNNGSGANASVGTGVKMYQCSFDFSSGLPAAGDSIQVRSDQGGTASGRNAAKLKNNGDNSYTIMLPLFTMPKSVGYITGFSGNNPYEAYKRRAKVLVTAYYKMGDQNVKICKRVPIFQQQRIVNPKCVWRTGTDTEPFRVRLMTIAKPNSTRFTHFDSDGEWSAWVATPGDESRPNTSSFISLSGNNNGIVKGSTGSKVDFTINFNGTTTGSRCAKVIVRYHGGSCEHAIFVRQGYNEPLAIVSGGALWSSYSVYAFQGPDLINSTTNLPTVSNINAELTVNPLALGNMYKRGNYGQGIRIINNKTYGVMVRLGSNGTDPLQLIKLNDDGSRNTSNSASWPNIQGIRPDKDNASAAVSTWAWATFHSTNYGSTQSYNYDVPSYDDYEVLSAQDFGIGVMYGDGATDTADDLETAYGYFNDGNTPEMTRSAFGMRGILIYNKADFNQIFFPVGYSGVGRRTVQLTPDNTYNGYLRYGGTYWRLSTGTALANQYRPITYNLPNNPGAIYWLKRPNGSIGGWDINYFDLSFSGYDAVFSAANGDALPIKPIVIGR